MRMKVSFFFAAKSFCIFYGTFASFTFLTTISLTVPHPSGSAVVDQNCCCFSVMKFIDFRGCVILFTMESVY